MNLTITRNDWFSYFRPNLFLSNILEIDIDSLVNNKIKMIIFDLDNTLAPHFAKSGNRYSRLLIQKIRAKKIIVVIASNNTKKRVTRFCQTLPKIDGIIWNALKPFPYKIRKLFKKFNIAPEQTLLVGDQFITDILVANLLKIRSILVTSLFNVRISQEVKKNSFKYFIENMIYKHLQLKNMVNRGDLSNVVLGTDDDIL